MSVNAIVNMLRACEIKQTTHLEIILSALPAFFILEGLLISNLLFLDTIYMPKKSITKSIMQCQLLTRF